VTACLILEPLTGNSLRYMSDDKYVVLFSGEVLSGPALYSDCIKNLSPQRDILMAGQNIWT
jgi:hypothetical protein